MLIVLMKVEFIWLKKRIILNSLISLTGYSHTVSYFILSYSYIIVTIIIYLFQRKYQHLRQSIIKYQHLICDDRLMEQLQVL